MKYVTKFTIGLISNTCICFTRGRRKLNERKRDRMARIASWEAAPSTARCEEMLGVEG
jgi:hypothetical protein